MAGLLAILLAGCGSSRPPVGEVGSVEGFLGGVAADEPRAALVMRDILSSGGSVADAAVAGFFTMAVTYPAGAGLGSGGVCLLYEVEDDRASVLSFRPAAPAAGGRAAVPMAPRAMAALHARAGRLDWGRLIVPAENLARFGHPMSRALAREVAAAPWHLEGDPAVARLFLDGDRQPLPEGSQLVQVALAATLTQIRTRGVGDLHVGAAARIFTAAAARAGVPIAPDDLRTALAQWQEPASARYGNQVALTDATGDGGRVLAEAMAALAAAGAGADQGRRAELVAEAYGSGPAARAGRGGDAALVAGDQVGNAVACTFAMGAPFGLAVMAEESGILLADAQGGAAAAAPLLMVNRPTRQAFFVGAASGGAPAPAALAQVAVAVHEQQRPLADALAAPRRIRLGPDGPVLDDADRPEVTGRVSALWCPGGFDDAPERCVFGHDPRGFGLAAGEGL